MSIHPEAALYVHSPRTGDPQMVGRFLHQRMAYDWIFWHETSESEMGLTIANDAHGGIDAATVRFLLEQSGYGAIVVHHRPDYDYTQYAVSLAYFVRNATLHVVDGRYRLFLDQRLWTAIQTPIRSAFLPRLTLPLLQANPLEGETSRAGH